MASTLPTCMAKSSVIRFSVQDIAPHEAPFAGQPFETAYQRHGSPPPQAQDFGNESVPVKAFCARRLIAPKRGSGIPWRSCLIFTPPFIEILWAHASVRGQRLAANMMLVRCNSDVPIS